MGYTIWKNDDVASDDHETLQGAIDSLADETGISGEALVEMLRKSDIVVDGEGNEWEIRQEADEPPEEQYPSSLDAECTPENEAMHEAYRQLGEAIRMLTHIKDGGSYDAVAYIEALMAMEDAYKAVSGEITPENDAVYTKHGLDVRVIGQQTIGGDLVYCVQIRQDKKAVQLRVGRKIIADAVSVLLAEYVTDLWIKPVA